MKRCKKALIKLLNFIYYFSADLCTKDHWLQCLGGYPAAHVLVLSMAIKYVYYKCLIAICMPGRGVIAGHCTNADLKYY
jgi:hypothetical protein